MKNLEYFNINDEIVFVPCCRSCLFGKSPATLEIVCTKHNLITAHYNGCDKFEFGASKNGVGQIKARNERWLKLLKFIEEMPEDEVLESDWSRWRSFRKHNGVLQVGTKYRFSDEIDWKNYTLDIQHIPWELAVFIKLERE